jgi:hypothetical protein
LERLTWDAPPWTLVQERRRSIRKYLVASHQYTELGEFLYPVWLKRKRSIFAPLYAIVGIRVPNIAVGPDITIPPLVEDGNTAEPVYCRG